MRIRRIAGRRASGRRESLLEPQRPASPDTPSSAPTRKPAKPISRSGAVRALRGAKGLAAEDGLQLIPDTKFVTPSAGTPPLIRSRLLADLDDRLEALMHATRRVRAHADDEAVHDLRVASRRLIAAVDVWRDTLRPKAARALRRRVRRLRRRAGAVRDVEVHAALLRDLQERLTGPPRELAASLGAERDRRAHAGLEHIRQQLEPRVLLRVATRHARATRDLRTEPPDAPIVADGAIALCERRAAQARAALHPALATGHPELLHAARVAIKKWRYASEILSALGQDEAAPLRVLRQLQQSLGRIQDANTLLAYLDEAAPDTTARAALRDTIRHDVSESLDDARRQARELP